MLFLNMRKKVTRPVILAGIIAACCITSSRTFVSNRTKQAPSKAFLVMCSFSDGCVVFGGY